MKALTILGYGDTKSNLKFQEVDKPTPKENEVLIECHAASINPIDYKIIHGELKAISKLTFPARIGFDVSGLVVAKGKNVKEFEIGDEVYSRTPNPGTFAEFIMTGSSYVAPKPKNLSFKEAACIPLAGITSLQALTLAQMKKGDRVLIHAGSGGVGSFAIQYAKSKGAYVITTTSTSNVSWVKALGADEVIDYKKQNYLEIVSNVDIVFETLGGQYTLDAFKVIKDKGRIVSIAEHIDPISAKEMGINKILRIILGLKEKKLMKLIRSKDAFYRFVRLETNGKDLREITMLIEEEKIKPIIDTVYSFEECITALQKQESGRVKGKLVIEIKK
ncbi:NADP-dependent oxidoreductase [Chengkuizengella sediminis]|uniref:NADP-dependent oxidoreductase n=1 Tax=Chengkuizengella sediminis TaxID=1885917 RepID=UPI00138A157D|nr:NADP-dependent oxidoreductase [Chengkuizengella sediminis]NDI35340.1 NADP-dependent oxidoreductase [Chengkuizengella sediminis]